MELNYGVYTAQTAPIGVVCQNWGMAPMQS